MTKISYNKLHRKQRMHLRSLGSAVAIIGFVLVGCSPEQPAVENPDMLVRIGGEVITVQDIELESGRLRALGRPVPAPSELLNQLVLFRAKVLKARELKLDQDPELQRSVDQLLVSSLRQQQVIPEVQEISDEAIQQRYQETVSQYTKPASDRLAVLFLELDQHASEQKRLDVMARMQEAHALATAQRTENSVALSKGFGALSTTHSDDQISRYRGGDIGWSSRQAPSGRVPNSVWQEGIELTPGQLSHVIEADKGLYLIMKTDSRPEQVTPLAAVSDSIRQQLAIEQREAMETAFEQDCLAWVNPQFNRERLDELSKEMIAPTNKSSKQQLQFLDTTPAL